MSLVVAVVFTIPSGAAFAATTDEDLDARAVMGSSMEEDEGLVMMSGSDAWDRTSSGTFYNGNGNAILTGAIAKGIDVSKHNGTIDWAKVAKSDIDYVIIRCGYGSNKTKYDDIKWKYNVSQCEKYGIPYGVYLYSYATTNARVDSEIAHVKRLLKGCNPQYPVYYDMEDKVLRNKGKTFITNAAVKFCSSISSAGYTSGVYASRSWWNSYLPSSKLDGYEKWIAEWNNTGTKYKKPYGMWQCTSSYKTSGVDGRVDLNFAYKKYRGNTPGHWAKDEEGKDIFYTYPELEGGKYDVSTEILVVSRFISRLGKTYYMDENGHKVTGFRNIGSYKYYFNSAGVMVHNCFFTVGGKKYYADANGRVVRNQTRKIGNYWYGFNASGVMLKGSGVIGNKRYLFGSDGKSYLSKSKVKKKTTVRKGPGKKYKKKGKYKKGKKVYIVRVQGSWSQMSNGYWIKTKYLKKIQKYPIKVAVKKTVPKATEQTQPVTTAPAVGSLPAPAP